METFDTNFVRAKKPKPPQAIEALDLYCGAGGLTHGLQQANIRVVAGVDVDTACKFPFEENNNTTFFEKDVCLVTGAELKKRFTPGVVRLLAGCAPCQPFSTYSNGKDATLHSKWGLLFEFERLVREVNPELVTMENVPQLMGHEPFKWFLETLRARRYFVDYSVVDCANYGVAQHRKRLVLMASRLGPINLPAPSHSGSKMWISVKAAVGDLKPIHAGGVDISDPLHRSAKLSSLNSNRMAASTPGGSWKDWPDRLVTPCHKKDSGKTYGSVYGRMTWGQPAPTMTTLCFGFGNGRFGHPKQDRAISLREAALFQSFPPTYKFVQSGNPIHFKTVGRMIGNAVPPRLGAVIGEEFVRHVRALS